jgi:roadblock/LC7 domain-containing protein
MYKIRFHLARGENFMKWQVRSTDGNVVEYYRPEKEQIAMFNAKLKVQLGTSTKIHEGACKTVCAWIECEDFQVLGQPDFVKPNVNDFYVRFNPRVNPNWVDMHGNIMNDEEYNLIVTQDRSLFVVTENHECEE